MARPRLPLKLSDLRNPKPVERHVRAIRPPAVGGVAGPPAIYDPVRFPHIANVLCKEYGFISEQLAKVFGVSIKTIESWLSKHKEFKAAVVAGRDEFDGVKVESMLLQLAMGFEYEERSVKSISVRSKDADGNKIKVPAKELTVTTKVLPPNAKAIQFWLTNRNPERWRQVTTVNANINAKTEHTETTVNVQASLENMDSTQLRALRDLVATQKTIETEIGTVDDIPLLMLMDKAREIMDAELINEQECT